MSSGNEAVRVGLQPMLLEDMQERELDALAMGLSIGRILRRREAFLD